MKNNHWALLLIIFVGLTAVLGQGCESIYRRYVNYSNGYSIDLPLGWEKLDEHTKEMDGMISSGVIFQKSRFRLLPGRFQGVRMLVSRHKRVTEYLYNPPNNYLDYLMSNSKIINRGQITINKRKAEWVIAQTMESLSAKNQENEFGKKEEITYVTMNELAYLIEKDRTTFYTIFFQTLEEDFKTYMPIFEKIIKSFKLTK